MPTIADLGGLEILDSRGRPTVLARCTLASGAVGSASVPSGASTGRAEALELRDGDPERYRGLGCRKAVSHLRGELREALKGQTFEHQCQLDRALIALDGTDGKARLGANAILAASLAFARAAAAEGNSPLYRHLAEAFGHEPITLPRPTVNLFSGGKHAGGQVEIQDVLLIPEAATAMDEALATVYDIYQHAAEQAGERYGVRALVADEGGLAPPFPTAEAMIEGALEAISAAGYAPGEEVALAVDVASSHFFQGGRYRLGEEALEAQGMIERLLGWLDAYPIRSIEDGLAEDDWDHWPELRERVGGRALVLGDDLLCSNPRRIDRALKTGAADALLLKVNQIGTLTEADRALKLARSAGWAVTVSARSGETEDDWLADLATGWSGDFIKIGSLTRSERLAKYNRLRAIEEETGFALARWHRDGNP